MKMSADRYEEKAAAWQSLTAGIGKERTKTKNLFLRDHSEIFSLFFQEHLGLVFFIDRDIYLITSTLYERKMYGPSRPQNI